MVYIFKLTTPIGRHLFNGSPVLATAISAQQNKSSTHSDYRTLLQCYSKEENGGKKSTTPEDGDTN